jgi:hypothetical protein
MTCNKCKVALLKRAMKALCSTASMAVSEKSVGVNMFFISNFDIHLFLILIQRKLKFACKNQYMINIIFDDDLNHV